MNNLSGLGIAIVTPFTDQGKIDFPALQRLVEHLISSACDFLVVLGTTAETPTLTLEEQRQVLDFVIEINAKKKFILVGLAGNHTTALCDRIESFNFTGVDAILSACPYYNKPTQEGLTAHFIAVAESSPVPVMLYNVPSRTGCNLKASTTLELAQHPNIFAIKEASGDLAQIDLILKNRPPNFLVFSGDDALTLSMIASGSDGVISVIGNALPNIFGDMVHQALFGQILEARHAHLELVDSIDAIFAEGNPSGIKAMLEHLRICSSNVRLPLVPATKELKDRIYACLAELDKLPN